MRVLLWIAALALAAFSVQAKEASTAHLLDDGLFLHEAISSPSLPLAGPSFRQLNHFDGLNTRDERAHYATLDLTNTWKQSQKYCRSLGYRLCKFKELCKDGKGASPVGASELPTGRVFSPIKSHKHGKNTWVRLTGDRKCTIKRQPRWGRKRRALRRGVKNIVACCTTRKLQKDGAKKGVVKSRRIAGKRAKKYADRQRRLKRSRRLPRRLDFIQPGVTLDGKSPAPAFTTSRVWSDSPLCDFRGARLHFTSDSNAWRASSWCSYYGASHSVPYTWLQIDFGDKPRKVRHVLLQGREDADQWVTQYRVQYSDDGANFKYVKGTFAGSSNRNAVVKSPRLRVKRPHRFWRVVPVASHGYTSLRFALLAEPSPKASRHHRRFWKRHQLVLPGVSFNGAAPPTVTASSNYDANHDTRGAYLWYAFPGHSHSWCARSGGSHNHRGREWIQIDFGNKKRAVTRVLVQGRGDYDQWVTKFRVAYSDDGRHFHKLARVFRANRDRNGIVSVKLKRAGRHRVWRILPKSSHGHLSLRFGLIVRRGRYARRHRHHGGRRHRRHRRHGRHHRRHRRHGRRHRHRRHRHGRHHRRWRRHRHHGHHRRWRRHRHHGHHRRWRRHRRHGRRHHHHHGRRHRHRRHRHHWWWHRHHHHRRHHHHHGGHRHHHGGHRHHHGGHRHHGGGGRGRRHRFQQTTDKSAAPAATAVAVVAAPSQEAAKTSA